MDKYIGRLLDNRYEILEVIGTGGMAVVYKARCHRLNRLVAIKILKDDYLEDEEFRRRFHSESQAVAMLSHPNIVSVYDVSTSITADYIVMELIDGITLKQYMEKKGVLNWKETLHFAIQIGKALEHAHSRGIVHRDIKPHNVMVLKNGSVKVTDFGIARMMSKGNTLTKEALGSVHYISPEQAKGGRVDNRSDIYSLGVVMYEMMSGRPPYDGESPVAVAIQHINGGAVMPSTLNPNIPGGLEQIIMKAMAHEPAARYNSAAQMLGDMDEFRKNPAILFDYNTPPTEEVTKLQKPPLVLEPETPRSTAEQVERRRSGEEAMPRRRSSSSSKSGDRSRRRASANKEEESHSNIATAAIIACSAVLVIAIVIFLVVLFSDGTGPQAQLMEVPNLVGQDYDTLTKDPNYSVQLADRVHNEEYEAGQIIKQEPLANTQMAIGETIYVTVSLGEVPKAVKMPDVTTWEQDQAERALDNLGINLVFRTEEKYDANVPIGKVISTDPVADTELTVGQTVILYISKGMEFKTSTMPELEDVSLENAKKTLEHQALNLDIVEEEIFDGKIAAGYIVRTEPAAGEELETGQTVTLYISKGPELVEITKGLVGLSVESVETMLNNKGFKCEILQEVSTKKEGTVLELRNGTTVLKPGDMVDVSTVITLVVATSGDQEVTKSVTIGMRGETDEGECHVKIIREDGTVVFNEVVPQGKSVVILHNQKGKGTEVYSVIIDETDGWEELVKFTNNG